MTALKLPIPRRPAVPRCARKLLSVDRLIQLLLFANLLLVGGFAAGLAYNMWSTQPGHPAQAPLTSASSSPQLMQMGAAHIPTNDDCVLCHVSEGSVGLKVVPAILHPIEGWRRCTVCHTNPELGRLAPGHQGISEEECLNCHKTAQAGPAITRPHAALANQQCLSCHGSVAHLPSSMASSKESDSILCHKPTDLPPPQYPHPADETLGCRECHQSPEVGGLPIDHALRSDRTCLLCHDIKQESGSPGVTFPLVTPTQIPGS